MDDKLKMTPDEVSRSLAWPYDAPRIYRCTVCREIKNTAYDLPCDDCSDLCTPFGDHVWTYPGRKWPYKGQPCSCGTVSWGDR